MTRFAFIAALFLSFAACHGCDNDTPSNDGSAQAQDAGHDGGTKD